MVRFVVSIADVNIAINAFHLENMHYYSDFITIKNATETVNVLYDEMVMVKNKHPFFSDIMCERAVLKYKIDKILVKYSVFPIHASAFAFEGQAYLLLALSGVGKSTHSKKWCEAFPDQTIMINDDRPYVKVLDNIVVAYSHPQSGKQGIYNNVSFPVRVLARIVRDKENYVKKVKREEFFPFIVQQSFTMDDPITTKRIIILIKKVIDMVALIEIHCNLDQNAPHIINDQLRSFLSYDN